MQTRCQKKDGNEKNHQPAGIEWNFFRKEKREPADDRTIKDKIDRFSDGTILKSDGPKGIPSGSVFPQHHIIGNRKEGIAFEGGAEKA